MAVCHDQFGRPPRLVYGQAVLVGIRLIGSFFHGEQTVDGPKTGTLGQELDAIGEFLSVPRDARERVGREAVWQACRLRSIAGNRAGRVLDGDFRELVRRMRAAQKAFVAARRDVRQGFLPAMREAEAAVDSALSDE